MFFTTAEVTACNKGPNSRSIYDHFFDFSTALHALEVLVYKDGKQVEGVAQHLTLSPARPPWMTLLCSPSFLSTNSPTPKKPVLSLLVQTSLLLLRPSLSPLSPSGSHPVRLILSSDLLAKSRLRIRLLLKRRQEYRQILRVCTQLLLL